MNVPHEKVRVPPDWWARWKPDDVRDVFNGLIRMVRKSDAFRGWIGDGADNNTIMELLAVARDMLLDHHRWTQAVAYAIQEVPDAPHAARGPRQG